MVRSNTVENNTAPRLHGNIFLQHGLNGYITRTYHKNPQNLCSFHRIPCSQQVSQKQRWSEAKRKNKQALYKFFDKSNWEKVLQKYI